MHYWGFCGLCPVSSTQNKHAGTWNSTSIVTHFSLKCSGDFSIQCRYPGGGPLRAAPLREGREFWACWEVADWLARTPGTRLFAMSFLAVFKCRKTVEQIACSSHNGNIGRKYTVFTRRCSRASMKRIFIVPTQKTPIPKASRECSLPKWEFKFTFVGFSSVNFFPWIHYRRITQKIPNLTWETDI